MAKSSESKPTARKVSGTAVVKPAPKGEIARDIEFARRLRQAMDSYSHAPEAEYGRLTWLKNRLKDHKESVSVETVRKWARGVSRPRPKKMGLIAKILEVDEAWLSLGLSPHVHIKDLKVRNLAISGATNVVAGLIQLGGGHPALPEPGGKSVNAHADLTAIIKGAQYAFHVALAEPAGENRWKFSVPPEYESVFILGVIQVGPMSFDMIELASDKIARNGKRRGGYFDVVVDKKSSNYVTGGEPWKPITGFSERF